LALSLASASAAAASKSAATVAVSVIAPAAPAAIPIPVAVAPSSVYTSGSGSISYQSSLQAKPAPPSSFMASKLSALASSKQLASPAPVKKSMSVFARTQIQQLQQQQQQQQQQQAAATRPNALVIRQTPLQQQQQQQQQLQQVQHVPGALFNSMVQSRSALLTSNVNHRPATAAAAAQYSVPFAPAATSSFSSSSVLCTPQSTSTGSQARRGVVWRDEAAVVSTGTSSSGAPLVWGELEDVRFLSPAQPPTPEKEAQQQHYQQQPTTLASILAGTSGATAAAGSASSSLGVGSLTASYHSYLARQTHKPMPDLSKTPSKSCLRRATTPGPVATTTPASVVPLQLGGLAELASVPSVSVTLLGPSSAPQRALAPTPASAPISSVQSGARRVPTAASGGGGMAKLAGAPLRTMAAPPQPQALGSLVAGTGAGLAKRPLSQQQQLGLSSALTAQLR
jgi:hypothetical protein